MSAPYLIGAFLALAVAAGAGLAGLDRERGFYPTLLIVIACTYDLFAVIGGGVSILPVEIAITAAFTTAAIIGFKRWPWAVVAGLALHGLMDLVHGQLVANPGVPVWWPGFCFAYDVTAAAYLGWRLNRRASAAPTAPCSARPVRPGQRSRT